MPALLYWTSARIAGGWLTEMAGADNMDVDRLLPVGEHLEAIDMKRGMRRVAVRDGEGRLAAALFVTRDGQLPSREWWFGWSRGRPRVHKKLGFKLWPQNKNAYSRHMFVAGLVTASGIGARHPSTYLEYAWLSTSIVSSIYFYTLVFRLRRCRHGLICQWRIFFFPWVIDPCPKCGTKSFD
ncbi:hypothetical protein SPHINGOR109_50697 [Sphingorhabdus sp. 109]|nr:hypothetical protein SPHINGOR109_50697 [Sphingorhabdus sp. 109]